MATLNKVLLIGNLTRDPELRMTQGGQAICKFGIAINRTFTGQDGQKKEEVTFVDVDCFGKTAENVGKYFTKGKPIFVEGRLKLDTWEKDGQKKSKIGVVLENFQFFGGKDDGEGRQTSAPAASRPAPTPPPRNDFAGDTDIPF